MTNESEDEVEYLSNRYGSPRLVPGNWRDIRAIETTVGREITPDENRMIHREITQDKRRIVKRKEVLIVEGTLDTRGSNYVITKGDEIESIPGGLLLPFLGKHLRIYEVKPPNQCENCGKLISDGDWPSYSRKPYLTVCEVCYESSDENYFKRRLLKTVRELVDSNKIQVVENNGRPKNAR